VADNGSTDTSAEAARALGATVISLPGLRVSALRNRAAALAKTDLLAFVDADHELGEGWVTAAVDVLGDPHVGAAGALYLPPSPGTWTQHFYGVLRGRTVGRGDTLWLGSGNLVVRRGAFNELSGFDESLETCEDVDFCQRLRSAGWRLVADERLVNVHLGDPRSLREVFVSERWRGRDNLRVSFRLRPTLRDAPSIVLPLAGAGLTIFGCAALVAALATGRRAWWLAGLAGLAVFATAALRGLRMIYSDRISSADWPKAYAVALAYESGRAASLLWPASHRHRQSISRPAPANERI
jgi:GT2 family glycosyltransferase